MSGFVHLSVHSEYSLVDGIVRVSDQAKASHLAKAVRERQMPAVALTDHMNVFAMVKFYKAAVNNGIQPVIGADIQVAETQRDAVPTRMTLLCANATGFRNLSRLLTRAYSRRRGGEDVFMLKRWLEPEALEGLIALSGGQYGELGRTLLGARPERATGILDGWLRRFPQRYYVELHRVGWPEESDYMAAAVRLAASHGVPVVATNAVRFLDPDNHREDEPNDFEAHEVRVCIQQGKTLNDSRRPRDYTEHQYLKSPAEMEELFADLPEALSNSVEIARRCSFELDLGHPSLPEFKVPEQQSAATYLKDMSLRGLAQRGVSPNGNGEIPFTAYRERLDSELEVICEMGFEGYFLIVADFCSWARQREIPVGPGRGSGAGSLIAFALGITDLDPLEHDLLFERFLNPERVSMPDFDIDFCIDGRDHVIAYVADRYGADRVSQIITFGTMAAKAVVRDVGRALGLPYGFVDRIAKLIPFELGITLEKALKEEELNALYQDDAEVRELIDLARKLEGIARNAGTHAGGVVISPSPLTEFMPLFVDPDGNSLSQLDKDDVEAIGLVKFDFLGLRTLTIIDRAFQSINRQREANGLDPLNPSQIPVDDPETYALLQRCQTTGVFQLESRGMRDLIRRLQPDHFGDLVAVLALFRPGPLQSGMVDTFINRKHGTDAAPVDYFHPSLKPILKPTYGVILYQEQVMQIAQVIAGYSLGGADLLRRAMGKKKPEEMDQQRGVFAAGAATNGVDAGVAKTLFDLMEHFAGYGFNKSHSAAYALIAYQTAWLKARHPAHFLAAVLTTDMDQTDKLVTLKEDCKLLGIELQGPDINRSRGEFMVSGGREISYGLGAIKGVGRAAVDQLVDERERNGPFTHLLDVCCRMDQQRLNRRMLEAFIRSGALDSLGPNRATLMEAVPDALKLAAHSVQSRSAGQGALFAEPDSPGDFEELLTPVAEWSAQERLKGERDSLGLYFSGHPFDEYTEHCRHFTHGTIATLTGAASGNGAGKKSAEVAVAGLVADVRRRGGRVSMILEDHTGRLEVTLFDEVFNQFRHLVIDDEMLVLDGKLRFDDFLSDWRLTARRLRSVDEAIEQSANRLTIHWPAVGNGTEFVHSLEEALEPFAPGNCEVCIEYAGPEATSHLSLGDRWAVRASRGLRERLGSLLGASGFSIHYPRNFI